MYNLKKYLFRLENIVLRIGRVGFKIYKTEPVYLNIHICIFILSYNTIYLTYLGLVLNEFG